MTNSTKALIEAARELKLCPFCGGDPKLIRLMEQPDNFEREVMIRCDDCAVSVYGEYASDAIAAWNRRAALHHEDEAQREEAMGSSVAESGSSASTGATEGQHSDEWRCADPHDCDWPRCGCNPTATPVLESIEEGGFRILPEYLPRPDLERLSTALGYTVKETADTWSLIIKTLCFLADTGTADRSREAASAPFSTGCPPSYPSKEEIARMTLGHQHSDTLASYMERHGVNGWLLAVQCAERVLALFPSPTQEPTHDQS